MVESSGRVSPPPASLSSTAPASSSFSALASSSSSSLAAGDADEGAREENTLVGALNRLPPERREKVLRVQKAFLDFRRLLLKMQLVETHMKQLTTDAELLPEIARLDTQRLEHQQTLIDVEEKMRFWESSYYERGAELSATFMQMINFVKMLAKGPLHGVMGRLQELYMQLVDTSDAAPEVPTEEVDVLVDKFRAFMPLLEDALLLDKPLMGRQHAMREKLAELQEENAKLARKIAELDEAVAMTSLDCETIQEFTTRASGITLVRSLSAFGGLAWCSLTFADAA